jgi:hypothetical protein
MRSIQGCVSGVTCASRGPQCEPSAAQAFGTVPVGQGPEHQTPRTEPAPRLGSPLSGVGGGCFPSIAIGADELGLISYLDRDPGYVLKVAHCNDIACTSATLRKLDSEDSDGEWTSVAIGADGPGLISYRDVSNSALKIAHCDNPACTSASTATLDSTGDSGRFTSVTVGADGLGLISYQGGDGDLKVAHCNDIACSSASTATLDSTGYTGQYTSVTIGADGLGPVAYHDYSAGALKVAHCNDMVCTSAVTTTLDSAPLVGLDTSVTVGRAGPDQLLRLPR